MPTGCLVGHWADQGIICTRGVAQAREAHVVSLGDWSSGKIPENWILGHPTLYKPARETHKGPQAGEEGVKGCEAGENKRKGD